MNGENVYTCRKCGGHTVTVDRDEGVTPFMIGCRESGEPLSATEWRTVPCIPKPGIILHLSFIERRGCLAPRDAKAARLAPRASFRPRKTYLSADRYTGLQIRWTNNRQRRLGHHQFDPEG